MSLVVVGASHKTMALDDLGLLAVPEGELEGVLGMLASTEGVNGAVVLSTCNRVEAYVDARTDRLGTDACRAFFSDRSPMPIEGQAKALPGFYVQRGEDVPRHLFRVASSLDSQILGEAQVLGQVKAAFARSTEAGVCTEVLTKLFKDALSVGKRVRTETAIGRDSVSLSTAAFKAAAREFSDISACAVVLVGAGEMADLTLTYLLEAGVRDIAVTSRTGKSAQKTAERCCGRTVSYPDRYKAMACADVVFSMTSAKEPVIIARDLDRARKAAGTSGRKLVIVDEAVPRDVQRECADLPGIILHNLETIGQVIDEGMAARMASVGAVEQIAAEAEACFLSWMQQRSVAPTIREIYAKGSASVEAELAHVVKSLAALRGAEPDPEERQILSAFGNAVMKKILHGPTARLRREAGTADSYYYTGAARYLFGLDTYPPGCFPHSCAGKECLSGVPCPKGLGR